MPRRGQCRCGLVLTFRRTPHGYKMRCPSCGAVVRLRVPKKPGRPPVVETVMQPPAPDEIDVELLAPEAPRPVRRPRLWPALLGGAALALVIGGAVWWFLH